MFCPNCGKQIPDDSKFCVGCGSSVAQAPESTPAQTAPQPAYQPVNSYAAQPSYPEADIPATNITVEKKKSKKPLLITLGALLLVAVLGVGAWLLFFRGGKSDKKSLNPLDPMMDAAEGSLNELRNYVKGELPNLAEIIDNVKAFQNASTIHLSGRNSYKVESSYSNFDGQMEMSLDYDMKAGKLRLDLDLSMLTRGLETMDSMPISLYLDKDQAQVSCDSLLDGQIYCIPFENFGRNWNKSALAELTNVTLPDDFTVPNVSTENLMKQLNEVYGKDWTDFYASIKPKKVSGAETRFGGFGTAYRIVWNENLLDKMAKQAEQEIDVLEDIDEPMDLEGVDFDKVLPSLVIYALSQTENLDRFQYSVNRDGNLIGLFVPDGEDGGTEIRLTGEQNIWQRIEVVEFDTDGGSEGNRTTLELEVSSGTLTIRSVSDEFDTDQHTVIYRDSDGTLTSSDAETEEGQTMTIRLTPNDGGASLSSLVEMVAQDENYSYRQHVESVYELSAAPREIRLLGANAKNLLEMSEEELQELAESINEKFQHEAEAEAEAEEEPWG